MRKKISTDRLPELVFGSADPQISKRISRLMQDGQLRRLDDWSDEYSPGLEHETRIYLRDINLEEKDAF